MPLHHFRALRDLSLPGWSPNFVKKGDLILVPEEHMRDAYKLADRRFLEALPAIPADNTVRLEPAPSADEVLQALAANPQVYEAVKRHFQEEFVRMLRSDFGSLLSGLSARSIAELHSSFQRWLATRSPGASYTPEEFQAEQLRRTQEYKAEQLRRQKEFEAEQLRRQQQAVPIKVTSTPPLSQSPFYGMYQAGLSKLGLASGVITDPED